ESSLPDSSSEAEIGTGDIIDLNIVKYQTKDEGKTVRFIYIANESAVEAANSGNVQLLVCPTIDDEPIESNTAVTTAYRSIYAGGQLITAPEGKVFILSPEVGNLSADLGSGVAAKFTLDSIPQRYARVYEP
ncbi:MAG: hypothetical protein ACI4I7_05370, partial [Oscillospiraceae bacterium]